MYLFLQDSGLEYILQRVAKSTVTLPKSLVMIYRRSTEIISAALCHLELWFLVHLNPGSSLILERKSGLLSSNIFHLEKENAETVNPIFRSLRTKNLIGSFVYELLDQTAGEKSPLLDWEFTWQHKPW